jgi:NAD(P)H-dependent FMN reductase
VRTLLIVWHSSTGAAQQMAEAAATEDRDELAIRLRQADTATTADVLAADGLLFVTPETLGSMAGAMKSFFERCYYPGLGQVNGRPYATMIAAGSDGAGALRDIRRIAAGWRLREVIPPLIIGTHAQTAAAIAAPKVLTEADRRRCAEHGATFAEGLALGIF